VDVVKEAIRGGYRHLDTAEMYGTELEVGAAVRDNLEEGIIKSREELFITTKTSDDFFNVTKSIDVSLQKLGLSYVDMYDSTSRCSLFLLSNLVTQFNYV
jgi:diketogulonate reductase-like aldo/keto reductase